MIDWLRSDPREAPRVAVGELHLPVIVRRHVNARRMTLRLSPDGREVRVTIPQWGRTAEALAFASARHDWLASQLAAIPPAVPIGDGSTIPLRGEMLVVRHDPAASRRPALDAGQIVLGGPAGALRARLRRWLETEARSLIGPDLAHYSVLAGKEPPRLALSNAQRRWGSCAPDGAIRINWRLVMAPDFVRRSVVAHEVAHLIHFDHSPRFHALLAHLFEGDVAEANAWLKREGRALYQPFG